MRRPALLATLALATACGAGQTRIGSAFSTNWENDGGRSIARLEQRLRAATIADGVPVAVGIVDDGLVGVPLASGSAWRFAHAISGRPAIASGVVVAAGGGEVFALDSATGRLLWKRATGGLELIGAGDNGDVTVVTLASGTGVGSSLLAITREGRVLRQLETEKRLGRPAVVGSVAFLPWQEQYVTAYDVATGDETARVVLRSSTSHAFTSARTLYFGEIALTRFDEKIGAASEDRAATARLPAKEIFGAPRWLPAAGSLRGTTAGAADKVRVYARPTPRGEPMAIADGSYYATYYRIVMGLDETAALRWVHTHDGDVLAGAAYAGGVAVCDANGKITFLDRATGAPAGDLSLGAPVTACIVEAEGVTRTSGGKQPPLVAQIAAALTLGDASMVTAQRFLLGELVRADTPEATKILLDLAADPRTSQGLLGDVRRELAGRRTGAEQMIAALDRRFDFVHDVLRPPPVGPLADALAAMKEKRAAGALTRALSDPQTPPDDVKRAAAALVTLATDSEAASLETFFALYRCTAENDDVVAAVVSIAQALVTIEGDKGKVTVARAVKDTMTLPAVREKLASLVSGVDPSPEPLPDLGDAPKTKAGAKKKPKG